jgi:predicted metal-dependent hydrolase
MPEIFSYQNLAINIIRSSRRKTIAIQIKAAQVSMLVPKSLPKTEIERLLIKKSGWIAEKLQLQTQNKPFESKKFISGESFCCLGQDYTLEIVQGSSPRIYLHENQLVVMVRDKHAENSELIKRLLRRWYQDYAQIKLLEKTRYYANLIGVTPASIVVKTFKARWGSCSSKKDIHYNWKIMMATEEVVDYLVVHELCHILHHNHSPHFWKTVEFYLPTYRVAKEWLKLNAKRLEIE